MNRNQSSGDIKGGYSSRIVASSEPDNKTIGSKGCWSTRIKILDASIWLHEGHENQNTQIPSSSNTKGASLILNKQRSRMKEASVAIEADN